MRTWLAALGAVLVAACSHSPTSPSSDPQLLGVWAGPIMNEAAGEGRLTLDVTFQIGSSPLTRTQGTFTLTFPDSRFDGTGTFTANLAGTPTDVQLFLSPTLFPCPQEPGGTVEERLFASLTLDRNTMSGTYGTFRCPGGMLTLTRQ
jgi:hypothetical protein